MMITIGRQDDKTNRIIAHFDNEDPEILDIPNTMNGHDIIDFILRVCDKVRR